MRKDVETVQAALIAREADLEEKLVLQKLKDELVAGSSRDGEAMVVDTQVDDEAILQHRELELLRSFARDATARVRASMCPSSLPKFSALLRRGRRRNSGVGNATASRECFGVVSWNVAGITASLLGSFLLNLSFHSPWSVLCLQEAFTKTEGLLSISILDGTDERQHVVFTPKETKKGLRAPAVIVRNHVRQGLCFSWLRSPLGCCVV